MLSTPTRSIPTNGSSAPNCGETDSAETAVAKLLALPEPPTAIFASNQRAGSAWLRRSTTPAAPTSLWSLRRLLPGRLSDPGVTVIDQDPVPVAPAAADRMLARLDGRSPVPAEIVLPLTLIARGSGEVPPCSRS